MDEKPKIAWWASPPFGKGFMAGTLFTLLVVGGAGYFVVLPDLQKYGARMDRASELSGQNWDKVMVLLNGCQEREADRISASTFLYEFEPGKALPVLGGLFEIRPGDGIAGPSGMAPYGRQVVRWYIPTKVKPVVYDDARGRAYSWYLHQEKKIEGPFVPEVEK